MPLIINTQVRTSPVTGEVAPNPILGVVPLLWTAADKNAYALKTRSAMPCTIKSGGGTPEGGEGILFDNSQASDSAYISGADGSPLPSATSVTFVVVVTPRALPTGTNEERLIAHWGTENVLLVEWYGPNIGFAVASQSGPVYEARYGSGSGILENNKTAFVVCTWDASRSGTDRHRIWINGKSVSITTWAANSDALSVSPAITQNLSLGCDHNGQNTSLKAKNSLLHAFGIIPVNVGDTLARDLSINPWQIFAPQSSPIFVASAGGGASATATVSGGIAFASSATAIRKASPTPSGGVVFAGGASNIRKVVVAASGGIAFAGSAGAARGATATVSGGIAFAGAAAIIRKVAPSLSSGVVFAGAASVSVVGTSSATGTVSGGVTLGGTAAAIRKCGRVATGGMSFAGAAAVSTHSSKATATVSGGVAFAGAAWSSGVTYSATATLHHLRTLKGFAFGRRPNTWR